MGCGTGSDNRGERPSLHGTPDGWPGMSPAYISAQFNVVHNSDHCEPYPSASRLQTFWIDDSKLSFILQDCLEYNVEFGAYPYALDILRFDLNKSVLLNRCNGYSKTKPNKKYAKQINALTPPIPQTHKASSLKLT